MPGTSLPQVQTSMPARVGRYQPIMPIGKGGWATVYLARVRGEVGFAREVALKVLHSHLSEEEEATKSFIAEARLASRIRHRSVVPVLDLGEDPHGVFLALEYVEGDSLAGLLKGRETPLPPSLAVAILADALA